MKQKTKVSIADTIKRSIALGHTLPEGANPIQSPLKKTTSLIGMAYLNYIYQNDLENKHFCESMLLMNSQIPKDSDNPYTRLFDPEMAKDTIAILEDIQLSFDYSISRTDPPMEKLNTSLTNIHTALKLPITPDQTT